MAENSPAEIVAFTLAFDDFEDLRIFAYLNEVEPDPDNLLHGYWEVELDLKGARIEPMHARLT